MNLMSGCNRLRFITLQCERLIVRENNTARLLSLFEVNLMNVAK
jgi:hypothetical protein